MTGYVLPGMPEPISNVFFGEDATRTGPEAPLLTARRLRGIIHGRAWQAPKTEEEADGLGFEVELSVEGRREDRSLRLSAIAHPQLESALQPQLLALVNAHNRELPLPKAVVYERHGKLQIGANHEVGCAFGVGAAQLVHLVRAELMGLRRLLSRLAAELPPGSFKLEALDDLPPPPEEGALPACSLARVKASMPLAFTERDDALHVYREGYHYQFWIDGPAQLLRLRCSAARLSPREARLRMQQQVNEDNLRYRFPPLLSYTLTEGSGELRLHSEHAVPIGGGLGDRLLDDVLDVFAPARRACERLLRPAPQLTEARLDALVPYPSALWIVPSSAPIPWALDPPDDPQYPLVEEPFELWVGASPEPGLRLQLRVPLGPAAELEALQDVLRRWNRAPHLLVASAGRRPDDRLELFAVHQQPYPQGASAAQLFHHLDALLTDAGLLLTGLDASFGAPQWVRPVLLPPVEVGGDAAGGPSQVDLDRVEELWEEDDLALDGPADRSLLRVRRGEGELVFELAEGGRRLLITWRSDEAQPLRCGPRIWATADESDPEALPIRRFTEACEGGLRLVTSLSLAVGVGCTDGQLEALIDLHRAVEASGARWLAEARVRPPPPRSLPEVTAARVEALLTRWPPDRWGLRVADLDPTRDDKSSAGSVCRPVEVVQSLDDDGQRWLELGEARFCLRVHEKVAYVLEVLGETTDRYRLEALPRLQQLVDAWNRERSRPKACFKIQASSTDVTVHSSLAIDYEPGATDAQLYAHLKEGIEGGQALFSHIHHAISSNRSR